MKVYEPEARRELRTETLSTDLVVVGGGLAGVCAAITAARSGIEVVLIQDRPVLGGNASSEVRLWILGATSHMGNNNRWAREGGVIDEILVENMYRNPEGNPLILDTILLEKVVSESNITLLLNTAVLDVAKKDADSIESVRAFCSQNSTMYQVTAPLFCDASGDGVVGFMAGAAFRIGAEPKEEFDEGFAPDSSYGELLGHSIYFYTKDVGKPVRFVPPSFALKDITRIPRYRSFSAKDQGCQLWWIEHGGRLDTVHDTERIKWELWEVVYGVWNYIKNSGEFPEAESLTLEWVGHVPGKRESRRFEGDYMMIQQDVIEQRRHEDAVSFGGWAVDLHPADGVFSEKSGCTQWHSKGVYQIPYRSMVSRNISNLFLAGRIISASHVAFGSTRVMATCAHNAQAVGVAAAICRQQNLLPRDLNGSQYIKQLQRDLLRTGQHIPHVNIEDTEDLAATATITASSETRLAELPPSDDWASLDQARAMLIPVQSGTMPKIRCWAKSESPTELQVELRTCSREDSFTPDVLLARITVSITPQGSAASSATAESTMAKGATTTIAATQEKCVPSAATPIELQFNHAVEDQYVMVCFLPNPDLSLALSDQRISGLLSLGQRGDPKVSKSSTQTPPEGIGIDTFDFWLPERRPGGKNIAMQFDPPLAAFGCSNIACGPERPTSTVNGWVADIEDASPSVDLQWESIQTIHRVIVSLDTDFDHAMESVLMGHPETVMPFCASEIRIYNGTGELLAERIDNHQTRCEFQLDAVQTDRLRIEVTPGDPRVPVCIFRTRIF